MSQYEKIWNEIESQLFEKISTEPIFFQIIVTQSRSKSFYIETPALFPQRH